MKIVLLGGRIHNKKNIKMKKKTIVKKTITQTNYFGSAFNKEIFRFIHVHYNLEPRYFELKKPNQYNQVDRLQLKKITITKNYAKGELKIQSNTGKHLIWIQKTVIEVGRDIREAASQLLNLGSDPEKWARGIKLEAGREVMGWYGCRRFSDLLSVMNYYSPF